MVTQQQIVQEMQAWKAKMQQKPGFFNRLSKSVQTRMNRLIPEKIHRGVTEVIKKMVQAVLFSAKYTTSEKRDLQTLLQREQATTKKIAFYKHTAAIEGGVTGAGGILLGLADFPLLLTLKIKLLFELASVYGFDTNEYKERVYLLHIFELAFSSHEHRNRVFQKMQDWEVQSLNMPEDLNQFDWRSFQQEYRDYIDLAKMAQLIPLIGAPVGYLINKKLIKKLGYTAQNAYRMRILERGY